MNKQTIEQVAETLSKARTVLNQVEKLEGALEKVRDLHFIGFKFGEKFEISYSEEEGRSPFGATCINSLVEDLQDQILEALYEILSRRLEERRRELESIEIVTTAAAAEGGC